MKFFYAIAILFYFLALPAQAQNLVTSAKAPATLTLTYQGQNFFVPAAITASWQGLVAISQAPGLLQPTFNAQALVEKSFGLSRSAEPTTRYVQYRPAAIYQYIKTVTSQINQPTEEPQFAMSGARVTNFTEPQEGLAVDVYNSTMDAIAALENGQATSTLEVAVTKPQQSLGELNNFGITTLIGRGVSNFKGSPNNRRHNIVAGIEKFKGLIVPQGATFSFDDNLGPVTAEAGFLPELVIDNGTTLPELGGGLCQVSTTAFRAAMEAGLPITDRRNHAYAVSYYFPQGTDATIYPGSADLKFVNDTPGAILIWPYEKDSNTLVFDFYGTDDNRKVTLEKPVVFDRLPDGSMKATWTRVVTAADGQIRTDVFKSNYQSPALFHKTESFIPAASSTPVSLVGIKKS